MVHYYPDTVPIKYIEGEDEEPVSAPIDAFQNDKLKGPDNLKARPAQFPKVDSLCPSPYSRKTSIVSKSPKRKNS